MVNMKDFIFHSDEALSDGTYIAQGQMEDHGQSLVGQYSWAAIIGYPPTGMKVPHYSYVNGWEDYDTAAQAKRADDAEAARAAAESKLAATTKQAIQSQLALAKAIKQAAVTAGTTPTPSADDATATVTPAPAAQED